MYKAKWYKQHINTRKTIQSYEMLEKAEKTQLSNKDRSVSTNITVHLKKTRNAWQSPACSFWHIAMPLPSEQQWNKIEYWSLQCLPLLPPSERS